MNARPTLLSLVLGVVILALAGPMRLLATVDDDTCVRKGAPTECAAQLVDGGFWLDVSASAVGSVAEPWDEVVLLLAPIFGIPWIANFLRKPKADHPTA